MISPDRTRNSGSADDADPVDAARTPDNSAIGGPLGRHVRIPATLIDRGRWKGTVVPVWQPIAAVFSLVAALMVALGVLQKSYCFENGWGGSSVFWRACYSDLPNMFVSSGLATSTFPYTSERSLTQPVGTGTVLWFLSLFTADGGPPQQFVGVWAVAGSLMAMALVTVTVLTARRRPQVAWMIAVSPLLITVVLVSADLVGVLLVSVGLLLWSREKEWAAGAVFGVAALSRSYALIVVAAVVLSALRAGRFTEMARLAAAAIGGPIFVLLLLNTFGLHVFAPYAAWLGASPEFGSLQYLLTLAGVPLSPVWATVPAVVGWVLALIVGTLMTMAVPRRPMIAEVAIVMLVIVTLTAKAVPPQWALWLLPLVALAAVPRRTFVLWMGVEVLYFVMVWMHIPYSQESEAMRALPPGWYAFFLVLRMAALAYLAWGCYRRAASRPVRRKNTLDEALLAEPDDAAGPAAGRRDRLVVTF